MEFSQRLSLKSRKFSSHSPKASWRTSAHMASMNMMRPYLSLFESHVIADSFSFSKVAILVVVEYFSDLLPRDLCTQNLS